MVTFTSVYDALRGAAVSLAVCMCMCTALRAQDDDKPPETRPTDLPALPDVLKEGTLELKARLYLPDGKGEPRFVPNMRLGDWLDVVRAHSDRSEEADLPTYSFDELKVEARVGADVADVTARAKVTLSENAVPVTAVNLRLQSSQLSQPIAFEGEGVSRWQVSRTEPGYTWWLQAEPNTTHTATLVGQSVLTTEGDRQSLQLTLPAAPVVIEAHLPTNYQDVRARGQGGELLKVESNGQEQKIVVRCLGGDVTISWRSGTEAKPVAGAAEATSKTHWRIDDPREPWEAETTISLRSYGEAPVEVLTVDLPEGAQWLATPQSPTEQFTITLAESERSDRPGLTDVPEANESTPGNGADKPAAADSPAATSNPATSAPATPNDKAAPAAEPAAPAARVASQRAPVQLVIRSQSRSGLSALESIPIRWRWIPPATDGQVALTNVSVPSIHIHAVDRHEGGTTLVIPEAYGLEWKSQPGTEFIQQSRVGDIQQQWQYGFRFARQPQGLIVNFRREGHLAQVRPTYLAEVDRGKVKLTGWLECAFDRSQRPELALELGDWELVSAEAISDMSSPNAKGELLAQQTLEGGLVKLSHDVGTEVSGPGGRQRQVWRIVAYWSLNEGSIEHLKLTVPGIMLLARDSSRIPVDHATGVLLMGASENVLVSWDERNSQSLLADAVSNEWSELLPPHLTDRATAYRFQAGAKRSPVWSGRVEVLPRRIAADQVAMVNIDPETARVTQVFTLQIANEPLQRLHLLPRGAQEVSVLVNDVPCVLEPTTVVEDVSAGAAEAAVSGTTSGTASATTTAGDGPANADSTGTQATALQEAASPETANSETANSETASPETASTDGKSLPPTSSPAPGTVAGSRDAGDAGRLLVNGHPKLFGKVVVVVRSRLLLPAAADDSNEIIVGLPLVKLDLPEAVLGSRAQVSIAADRRVFASLADATSGTDVKAANATSGSPGAWSPLTNSTFDIAADDESLQLRIRRLDEVGPLPVRVTGAWMQTAVSGSTRLDRFCARFLTQQEMLVVTIPSLELQGLRVTVDGIPLNPVGDTTQRRLQLNLQDVKLDGEHTLEVWTWSANSLGWSNAIDVIPVTIEGCPRFEHFYWQLVTPPSQHLIFVPDSVTAEWRWVWDRFWWHRYSPQDQPYFEQWLGASTEPPLAESAHRYVVSTYGPVEPFRCWTASRLLLWLPIGLVAIGCAMAVSIWRVLRHPVSVVLLAAAIAAFAVTWPDLAILVGQTSLLALAIVMLYALTQAAVESRVRRRSIFTTRPMSGMLETSDQHSLARLGSHASSEVVATTRTQSPIVADSGGH